ncbi:MAG: Lpg1974 family pore-forming outer membrane protein [Rubripirellula sp.]
MITRTNLCCGWTKSLVLAGLAILFSATACSAQISSPLIDQDATMVHIDDSEVSQAGFLGKHKASGCDGCGEKFPKCCCGAWWSHQTGGFGQFLLLRPGNVDQIFAIEQNTIVPGDFPTGPVGRVNIDEEAAFRVGFTWAASDCTSLVTTFTRFEGNTSSTINATPTNVLNSQIIHPSTLTVGAGSLQSTASYSLDFQLIDLAYRHVYKTSDCYAVNWLAGFRYANMEQDFQAQQNVSVATGLVNVDTDVDFNGFGMLFGVDAERRSSHSGLSIYGKGISSFLAGDWRGTYRQTNQFGGGVVANEYEDYRVTPVVELELGFAWRNKCGNLRANIGYMTSAWYNAISNREYVDAVRNNNYVSIDETITFNGLTSGLEYHF